MKVDPIGRRMFLTGAGMVVALPFLESLLPRVARAKAPTQPLRYIQVINPFGATTEQFYGSLTGASTVQANVSVKALADVKGALSPFVGSAFDALRSKISLIHGMDVIAENNNHQMCFPTCASGYANGLDGDEFPPLSDQPSIDVLMSESDVVYDPSTPTSRRLLTLNPVVTDNYTSNRSFSWKSTPDGLEMIRPVKTTLGIMDLLASAFDDGKKGSGPDLGGIAVIDAVYDDYARVRDSSRLSKADRERLENYMSLVSELTPVKETLSCTTPMLDKEPDIDAVIDNQYKVLAAAMLCDVTRVASITLGMSASYNERHDEHHDEMHTKTADKTGLYADMIEVGERVANLLEVLDATPEPTGSVLDNSIVYWGMQYGNAWPVDAHRSHNMPVLVAGGAGGQLKMGEYIDFRKDGHLSDQQGRGIPINNLLVTFMNCLGLTSTDYEAKGQTGYGYYNDRFFENPIHPDPDFWSSTAGRRSALPYFYTGTTKG